MQVNSNQPMIQNAYGDMRAQRGQDNAVSNQNRAGQANSLQQNAQTQQKLATESSTKVTLSGAMPGQKPEALTYDFAVKASAATASMTQAANATQAQMNASPASQAISAMGQSQELPQTQSTNATQGSDNKGQDKALATGEEKKALGSEEEKQNKGPQEADLEDPRVQSQIAQLKQREQEVITHENAHKAMGGQYAGSASYEYTTGPDNKRYIDGGEVSIHTPSTSDPEEAKRINETVRKAALAPAQPSGQDLAVAASAAQKIAQAESEIAKNRAEEASQAREDRQANQKKEMNLESDKSAKKTNPAAPADASERVQDLNYIRAKQVNAANAYSSMSGFNRQPSNNNQFHAVG